MKYVSIDIETTGLDPETCQILSFAAIVEDTQNILAFDDLPKLELYFFYETITGDPKGIMMNTKLIEKMSNLNPGPFNQNMHSVKNLPHLFTEFLSKYGMYRPEYVNNYLTVAGANISFDLSFLSRIPDFTKRVPIGGRTLDPSLYYANFEKDIRLPSLETCKARSGLFKDATVAHEALEDAWDVIKLLRPFYEKT